MLGFPQVSQQVAVHQGKAPEMEPGPQTHGWDGRCNVGWRLTQARLWHPCGSVVQVCESLASLVTRWIPLGLLVWLILAAHRPSPLLRHAWLFLVAALLLFALSPSFSCAPPVPIKLVLSED